MSSSNSYRFLTASCPEGSFFHGVPKKITLGSCGSEFSSWFLGAVIWEKFRVSDSVLLVHSKIATILENNSDLNKSLFIKMLYPLPGIKNTFSVGGGYHFRLPYVSTPHCFNVKHSSEMRRGLTQHLTTVLILPKQLLARSS